MSNLKALSFKAMDWDRDLTVGLEQVGSCQESAGVTENLVILFLTASFLSPLML